MFLEDRARAGVIDLINVCAAVFAYRSSPYTRIHGGVRGVDVSSEDDIFGVRSVVTENIVAPTSIRHAELRANPSVLRAWMDVEGCS